MDTLESPDRPGSGPTAYFITFVCYGARLHGDERGSVDLLHNVPHSRFVDANPNRLRFERQMMKSGGELLDTRQRYLVLESIKQHALYRRWVLHAAHVRSDHVHVVVTCDGAPERAMTQFKIYASRALNQSGAPSPRRWARHGSTRYLWERDQVDAAVEYLVHQQGRPMALYVNADRWRSARHQPNPEGVQELERARNRKAPDEGCT